jgi:hypothetical protein
MTALSLGRRTLNFNLGDIANRKTVTATPMVVISNTQNKFIKLNLDAIKRAFEFSFAMAKAEKHRPYRSGGLERRKPAQMMLNTMTGKLGEEAYRAISISAGRNCSEVDYRILERGQWDEGDLMECYGVRRNHLSIKTIQHFSRYLLLERKDYLPGARLYLETKKKQGAILLCSVKFPYRKTSKIFQDIDFDNTASEFDKFFNDKHPVMVAYLGHISNKDLVQHIDTQESNKDYFHQGNPIGKLGKMVLDADNYYLGKSNLSPELPWKWL